MGVFFALLPFIILAFLIVRAFIKRKRTDSITSTLAQNALSEMVTTTNRAINLYRFENPESKIFDGSKYLECEAYICAAVSVVNNCFTYPSAAIGVISVVYQKKMMDFISNKFKISEFDCIQLFNNRLFLYNNYDTLDYGTVFAYLLDKATTKGFFLENDNINIDSFDEFESQFSLEASSFCSTMYIETFGNITAETAKILAIAKYET